MTLRTQDRIGAEALIVARALVAALIIVHVLLERSALREAHLLGAAALAAGVLVCSSVLALVTHLRQLEDAPQQRVTTFVAALDAVALITVARISVSVDPSASIAWCFVLWVPFSLAMLLPPRAALWGTFATGALVAGAGMASPGEIEPLEAGWVTVAVPVLLTIMTGLLVLAGMRSLRVVGSGLQLQLAAERDHTERLRAADELKNTFLAAVSHELRTPLTSILGFALTVVDRPGITTEQRNQMLRMIVQEAEHLEDILANLLDLDRLTRGKATLVLVEVDPANVIRAVARLVETRSGRSIELDLEEGDPLQLDAAKLERIVENLISNAVKYTPCEAGISVRLRREASGITIRVDDEGPGISADLREGIFEPFRRGADRGVPGTGIGLSLVDEFARMHGGRAWVEERPGGGSRFQVYLPAPRTCAGLESTDPRRDAQDEAETATEIADLLAD